MRLFLAIVDHGSLMAAAEHLDLTQPTVGRRLAAMEKRFGTPLFVRAGRRMQLTDSGTADPGKRAAHPARNAGHRP